MKKQLLFTLACLTLYQTFGSGSGKAIAGNAVPDTLSWAWEVSSTVSTRTKTCTIEFSDNLLINWGDGVTEWIPDSLSSETITHVYAVQANYNCTAIGVGISYFKGDSRRVLNLDTRKAPGLTYLSCTSNQISSLDLSMNTLLVSLYCGSNNLKKLDLSRNVQLQTLTCSDNQLAELDVSMLPTLKKITCHTNPLVKIGINSPGALNYLSCSGCSLTAERLDSIFMALPTLGTASTSKNLYVLNNPGSSSCHSEIAAAKNWMLDRVITQSSFYVPSVTCKTADSIQVKIYLKNTAPAIAFELDVNIPNGFELDTLRSSLNSARKGQHVLSISRMPVSAQVYKMMAYSLKVKDLFSGTDGSVLELFLKAPAEMKTYTLDIQKAILLDTLTNPMDISVTDGQMTVMPTFLAGDANGDAMVDVTDIVNLVAWINGRHPVGIDTAAIDIDGNGLWNIVDITRLVVMINSNGILSRDAFSGSPLSDDRTLRLYQANEVPPGNHLFVRQSADGIACLELCLDNKEEVQAFQADVILPEGLSLQTGQLAQETERNAGHLFSISMVSPNCYRLLSYALKADAVFPGKSGVLVRLPLVGVDEMTDGIYPIAVEQPVLTGLNLKSVTTASYDALITVSHQLDADQPITFGTDGKSHLWVHGGDILDFSVWDITGQLIFQKKLDGVDSYSIPAGKGVYLVRAKTRSQNIYFRKVAVR